MTSEIIEGWFRGEVASMSGLLKWDANQVKEMLVRNGGGWHGLGWLGKGKWAVQRTSIASDGQCLTCSEQLVCVDIAREETETFAYSVSSLAMERESQSNFKEFQDWLESHSEFEAVVDGANIGLYQQNFAEGGFSASQSSLLQLLIICIIGVINGPLLSCTKNVSGHSLRVPTTER
ncbi:unnamed protein product [Cuscuta epithymum]|uniref:ribonuclease P n=1 Tax=Cuscuta epithymum TaxID=186058 RepID=A0AAV0D6F0_9ASTE|nr:unnamed protein product [Cuscuta epithymum]